MHLLLLAAALVVATVAQTSNCTGSVPLTNTVSIVVVPGTLTLNAGLTLSTPSCGAFTASVTLNGIGVFSALIDPK